MTQLLLDISPRHTPSLENFVSGRNAELLQLLRDVLLEKQKERFIYLWGSAGSGRSHLLKAMVDAFRDKHLSASYLVCHSTTELIPGLDQLDCVAVDDVERLGPAGQIALFNLYNHIRESGQTVLLVSGRDVPSQLPLREDLVTRLGWGLVYQVHGLNDEEKAEALRSHGQARGFAFPQDVIDYLLRREQRDLPSLLAMLDALDRYSLQTKRPITVPMLKELMQTPRKE